MQQKYEKDIWGLGNSKSGYPGAFPNGLIQKIKRKWWGQDRLWLFSGSYKDPSGMTVDIKKELSPSVITNCEALPFKDNSFDFVMADPPYSELESKEMYDLPYVSIVKVINEMIRVCRPGGYILLLHRLVPTAHPYLNLNKYTNLEAIIGIFTVAGMTNIRALTVFKKKNTLDAYI